MKQIGRNCAAALCAIALIVFTAAPAVAEPTSTTTSTVAPTDTASPAATPVTTPTITDPIDAASVMGDVPVTATSAAPSVQFYLDSVAFGGPAPVVAGSASTVWPTWGMQGTHAWTAADCDTACSLTLSTSVNVTIANNPPVVTSPADGATTGTSVVLQATADGGGLSFSVDGVPTSFDATSPYSLTTTLAPGAHSVQVQQCDVAGTFCGGLASGSVSFTVAVLHPTVASGSPSPFSPHPDGRGDHTSFRIHLPETENVSFSIRNTNNTVIQGPHAPGVLAPGDHTARWDGKTNAGKIAGDGIYTIVVDTTRSTGGVVLHGKATATVRVDDTAPTLSGINGNGFTFYPVTDGYIDTFGPKVTVNEGGGLWLEIYNAGGVKVREMARPHAGPGTFKFGWDGRTAGGQMLREGTFRYFFKAIDRAGNLRVSANYHVFLRHARLVNKTATLLRNGDNASAFDLTAPCTAARISQSTFAHGVWLINVCDEAVDGFQVAAAEYTVSAPGAKRYNSIRIRSYGNTVSPPNVIAAIIYNWSTGWKPFGAFVVNQHGVNAWGNYGTKAAAGFVSGGHAIRIGIGIGDSYPPADYDIGLVEITVSYAVLQ